MKLVYFFLAYTSIVVIMASCAAMIEALEDEDWSLIGSGMHQTGRNIQQEQAASRNAPTVIQQQYRPIGSTCMTELVRNPNYGHYEALQICR